jgi:hypothetical protein
MGIHTKRLCHAKSSNRLSPAGPNKTIAVKMMDDRGNELLVTKALND